jgi:hypothetical protein
MPFQTLKDWSYAIFSWGNFIEELSDIEDEGKDNP